MRLLLTSAGVRNEAITTALNQLIQRPFEAARVAFIVTAAVGQAGHHDWLVADINRVYGMGWRAFTMVELNGAPKTFILRRLAEADVIYATGGNAYHLARSFAERDLATEVASLLEDRVYVGASAGSMIFARRLSDRLVALHGPDDEIFQLNGCAPVSPFNLVDWWVQPHVDFATWDPEQARRLGCRTYAIDDQSALRVVDRHVDAISEGQWRLVEP